MKFSAVVVSGFVATAYAVQECSISMKNFRKPVSPEKPFTMEWMEPFPCDGHKYQTGWDFASANMYFNCSDNTFKDIGVSFKPRPGHATGGFSFSIEDYEHTFSFETMADDGETDGYEIVSAMSCDDYTS